MTGFLQQLCSLTHARVYCLTAQRFRSDLTTPPKLTQLTFRGRTRRPVVLRFALSKVAHVGVVLTRGKSTRFSTSAYLPHGIDQLTLPPQIQSGAYGVRIAATDLAGNFTRITGRLQLSG